MLSRSVVSNSLWPHGLEPARVLYPWELSREEYWSELPCSPPRDCPNPGIEPRCPALQVDSLLSEPPGKPENTGVGSLSLLQGFFPTQVSNWVLLHRRQILYQLSHQASPCPQCLLSISISGISLVVQWLKTQLFRVNLRRTRTVS